MTRLPYDVTPGDKLRKNGCEFLCYEVVAVGDLTITCKHPNQFGDTIVFREHEGQIEEVGFSAYSGAYVRPVESLEVYR